MTASILQSFLRLRLLDIGPDDTRLLKLNEATEEFAALLANEPQRVVAIALIAYDSNVTVDPTLNEIATVIEKHWPTYASAFPHLPVTLFRAVALEALRQAQDQQPAIATALTLIARNVLPHIGADKEKEALSNLLERANEIMAAKTNAAWASGRVSKISPMSEIMSI